MSGALARSNLSKTLFQLYRDLVSVADWQALRGTRRAQQLATRVQTLSDRLVRQAAKDGVLADALASEFGGMPASALEDEEELQEFIDQDLALEGIGRALGAVRPDEDLFEAAGLEEEELDVAGLSFSEIADGLGYPLYDE